MSEDDRPLLLDLRGGQVKMDREDFERLEGKSVYVGTNGYAYFSTEATGPVTVHSFVMGGSSSKRMVDHINGDTLDNRKSNLRFANGQQNQANRHRLNRNNSSGLRGVAETCLSKKNPWRAQIMVDHRQIHIGMFATSEEAVEARRLAELYYYGEECRRG